MTRVVRPQEVRAVTALPGAKRYEYFVKRVVDAEEVWSLRSAGGWVMSADDSGNEVFPAWSDAVYAEACREDEWAESEPCAIPMSEWMDKWLPGLKADNRRVAVFPVRGEAMGTSVDPLLLLQNLRVEQDRY